jgi:ribose transport system substrate-binding protein
MKIRTTLAALAATGLLVTGCSTGASDNTGGSNGSTDEGSAGLAVTESWDEARGQLYGSLEGKTIAYVPMSLQFELTRMWGEEFKGLFEREGATYLQDDAGNDVDAQIRMIDSHINDGVDVLIIQNPDVGVLTQQVQRAHEEGIYVISVNVQGNQSSDAYVGADYVAMGKELAERIVTDCQAQGKNKVAVLTGFGTDSTSIQAEKGWMPVLEEAGMEIVSHQQSNYDPTKANQVATAVLQKHQDLCAFAVIFDITALGVVEAVEAAGLEGKVGIYNFDASAPWCRALRAGKVTAGAAYNASGISVAAAYQAQSLLLRGAPAGSQRVMGFVPHAIADKDNVDTVPGACYGKE